jgi:hypothetical protein
MTMGLLLYPFAAKCTKEANKATITTSLDEENSESKVNGVITPLSPALRKGADDATLRVISHAFPDALSVHDDYGLTPLSFCCQVYQRSK